MPDAVLSLSRFGGARQIQARWVIETDLVLTSATLLRGRAGGPTDMPVLRDALDGSPLLPGSSLAGALRSHLADLLGGYGSNEHEDVSLLFGARRVRERHATDTSADPGVQSPLIIFDSIGRLPDGLQLDIRDGIALSPRLGTAEEHKKFDFEVLPPGTAFPVRVELVIEDLDREPKMLSLLDAALSGFKEGDIRVGARRSRGLGSVEATNWRARRFGFSSDEGWLLWLLTNPRTPFEDRWPRSSELRDALTIAWPNWREYADEVSDQRKRVVVELSLQLDSGLLIRRPGTTPDSPDDIHLTSGGDPVISGSSLAGALRNRALRITRLVSGNHADANAWAAGLFGACAADGSPDKQSVNKASRLRVSESVIHDGASIRPTRIRIDRLTQGVIPGALFDEQPVYGGVATVRLELRQPRPDEIGLLLLLVKDLISGDLPLGGATSIGRGVLTGSAVVRLDGKSFDVSSVGETNKEATQKFNEYIAQFHKACRDGKGE